MVVDIALGIAYLHLCNTSRIIFIYNGWSCDNFTTTRLLYVVDHSVKLDTFT